LPRQRAKRWHRGVRPHAGSTTPTQNRQTPSAVRYPSSSMGTYQEVAEINRRPACFEQYTARDLWTDEHTSSRMLAFHLDGSIDVSSRKTEFIDRSAAWIISRFGLAAGRSLADFGCGPGLYTSRLAASGVSVTGIDFSERSLRHAREAALQQGLSIEYVRADYLEFAPGKLFDLITLIMCDYCALSPTQRRALLDRFRTLLHPGGAVLLDVYSLSAFAARQEAVSYSPNLQDGFWSAKPYFGFLNTFKYEPERVVLDKYTIVEEARTRTIYNWLRYFDPEDLKGEIDGAGLQVEEFLGDVAGGAYDPASHEFAAVVRKAR
jgi:2-polyprenyl-3-methyl-5-hydroxy-6-metoxy-1,4-benzoquinol methylase